MHAPSGVSLDVAAASPAAAKPGGAVSFVPETPAAAARVSPAAATPEGAPDLAVLEFVASDAEGVVLRFER